MGMSRARDSSYGGCSLLRGVINEIINHGIAYFYKSREKSMALRTSFIFDADNVVISAPSFALDTV